MLKSLLTFLLTKDTLTVLIVLGVVLAAYYLRTLLAAGLIRLLFNRIHRKNPDRYREVKTALKKPASFMIVAGVIRAGITFVNIQDKYEGFVTDAAATLFLIMAIWLLYSAASLAVSAWLAGPAAENGKTRVINQTAAGFISSAIQVVIVVIGVLMVLSYWVKDLSGLIAGFGIGGLAIALAAQDTASNLFGSIALMLDKPFEVGDWVEVEGFMGTVEKIGLRSSLIRSIDQSLISIPNSRLANSNIVNGARRGKRRVAFKLGVVYATPSEKLNLFIERIRQILTEDPDVETDAILVFLDGFGNSSLDIQVAYATVPDFKLMTQVKERVNYAILQVTIDLGISIAFPSVSVYQGSLQA